MTLHAPVHAPPGVVPVVPPTVLFGAPWTQTPTTLAMAVVPSVPNPMKLPSTVFDAALINRITPMAPLPAMMLRALAVVPPTVVPVAELVRATPALALATAAVPLAFTPMKFPWTVLPAVSAP